MCELKVGTRVETAEGKKGIVVKVAYPEQGAWAMVRVEFENGTLGAYNANSLRTI